MVSGVDEGEEQTAVVMTAVQNLATDLSSKGILLREITLSFLEDPKGQLQVATHRVEEVLEDPEFTTPAYPGLQGVFALFREEEDV